METAESRAKLANAIRTMQANGQSAQIPSLVSAYKVKYQSTPVPAPSERDTRITQGLPVSSDKRFERTGEATPNFGGEIVRSVVKPIARLGQNLTGKMDDNGKIDSRQSNYLGTVNPVGNSGNFGKDVLDSIGVGAEIGSNLVGGTGAGAVVKTGIKGAIKQGAVTGLKSGIGAGATYGLGAGLQDQKDKNVGQILGNTAIQAVKGGAIGGLAGGVLGGAIGAYGAVKKTPTEKIDNYLKKAFQGTTGEVEKLDKMAVGAKRGLERLSNELPNIKIADSKAPIGSGVTKQFNPKKASGNDWLSAVAKQRDDIAEIGRSAAENASRQGIKIDTTPAKALVMNAMKTGKIGKSAGQQLLNQLDNVDGDPLKLHQWIQDQVNIRHFKVSGDLKSSQIATVANDAGEIMRETLDTIVDRKGYAQAYGDNRDLYRLLISAAKKANRNIPFGDITSEAGLDAAISILTSNPAYMARTLASGIFKGVVGKVRNNRGLNAIRNATNTISKIPNETKMPSPFPKPQPPQPAGPFMPPAPKPGQPRIQQVSGRVINLPKRTQSAVDAQSLANLTAQKIAPPSKIPSKVSISKSVTPTKLPSKPVAKTDSLLQEAKKYKSAEEFATSNSHIFDRSGELVRVGDNVDFSYGGSEFKGKLVKVNNFDGSYETTSAKGKEFRDYSPEVTVEATENIYNKGGFLVHKKGDKFKVNAINLNEYKENYSPVKTKSQLTDIWNKANKPKLSLKDNRGFIATGFKNEGNLTTKILKDLEGKTTVSKQYILDATNRGELKQVERDITRQVLDTMPGNTVDVNEFADKIKSELLPLKVETKKFSKNGGSSTGSTKYESIALPDELRGNVANYKENIYESPIATSAGDVHFAGKAKNYFGHTRIEDMADNKTRRVIEVQSDLYQKGNLEREVDVKYRGIRIKDVEKQIADLEERIASEGGRFSRESDIKSLGEVKQLLKGLEQEKAVKMKEIAPLQQYNDPTAHFRMVREEIKKASQDGKTKLQFPTGETAMKIEGLGQGENRWFDVNYGTRVDTRSMKVGDEITHTNQLETNDVGSHWIITDVLGDGKFKAVPKDGLQRAVGDETDTMFTNTSDMLSYGEQHAKDYLDDYSETFDISGKVDTNNPIYKFYEKEVQKYLNKFGGKRVVDDKGVSWIEIPITKEQGISPVDAFGKIQISPLYAGAGLSLAGVAGAGAIKKRKNGK
jgi:hypothetical protein